MGLRVVCLICALATPQLAAAQVGRVVVLAPAPIRAPLCDALAIELGTRGAMISPSLRPADGDFVVALREYESGDRMVLIANRTGREVLSPRLRATDGPSLAAMAVILFDEMLASPDPAPHETSAAQRSLAAPPPPEATDQAFFDDPAPWTPDGARDEHALMFGASLGGGFLTGDGLYARGGGPLTRLRLGWRFRNLLRVAASVEGAFISQEDPGVDGELQPTLLPCLETSLSLEIGPITGHLGARGCVTIREYDRVQFPGSSGTYAWGRVSDVLALGYGVGGFVAASVYTSRRISLWLRADALAVETDLGDWPGVDIAQGLSMLGILSLGVVVE